MNEPVTRVMGRGLPRCRSALAALGAAGTDRLDESVGACRLLRVALGAAGRPQYLDTPSAALGAAGRSTVTAVCCPESGRQGQRLLM